MSEYQYVEFRAIDRPLDDRALAFMQRQSTRAEITRWSFTNEYHFGDFHGNAIEMLRRGYDVHLQYANFGIRKLMFRLPRGLPLPAKQCQAYLKTDGLRWHKDGKGPGGVLEISPYLEPGEMDDLWDLNEWLDLLVPLRQSLVDGDPRPLYAAWLCATIGSGQEAEDLAMPPLPVGWPKRTLPWPPCWNSTSCRRIGWPRPRKSIRRAVVTPRLPHARQRCLIRTSSKFVRGWAAGTRRSLWNCVQNGSPTSRMRCEQKRLRRFANRSPPPVGRCCPIRARWPTSRTRPKDWRKGETIEGFKPTNGHAAADWKRLARDPKQTLKEVDALFSRRNSTDYQQAAQLLTDLREALGPEKGTLLVRTQAAALRRKYAGRNQLISVLRKAGLLDK